MDRGLQKSRPVRSRRPWATLGSGPPYVVVAHSFAGFSGRVFIGEHRPEVFAAVMLDTSTPEGPGSGYGFFYRMDALKGHLGVGYVDPPPNGYASLPPPDAMAAYAASRWTSHQDASADELDVWELSAEQTREAGTLGDMPLLVVTTTGASAPRSNGSMTSSACRPRATSWS